MNKNRLSMFNVPNTLTTLNMLSGVLSILFSLSGRLDLAPYPIFLGAIFDFLDGFVARILKQQGELGKQLDSLADMITFGFAPGIMMMVLIAQFPLMLSNDLHDHFIDSDSIKLNYDLWMKGVLSLQNVNLLPFIALLIPVFSMFRLAKFNLDTRQSESFIGLPTPANTLFFCVFPLVLFHHANASVLQDALVGMFFQEWVLIPIIIVMSILLVSEIPLFSLKFKHFKWKGNEIRYVFLITCSLLILFTMYWSIGIIVILYLILSVIENIYKGKKNEI